MCFQRNIPINRSKKSLKQLNELIAQNPDDYRHRLDRALLYAFDEKHKNLSLAKEDIQQAARICKRWYIFISIAQHCLAIDDAQSALLYLEMAKKMDHERGWDHSLVGLCYLRLKNYDEAIANLSLSIEDRKPGKGLEEIKYLSECYGALGEYEKEMESLLIIISETEQLELSLIIPQLHLEGCFKKDSTNPIYLFLNGYNVRSVPAQAIDFYSKALDENPRYAVFYAYRATSFVNTGDLQRALSDISKALEIEPDSNRYSLWRAQILDKMGESDKVKADFRKAFSNIGDPDYYYECAKICINIAQRSDEKTKKKYFMAAEYLLRSGLRCMRPSKECLHQLGILFELKMEYSKAKYYFRKAEKIDLSATILPFTRISTI